MTKKKKILLIMMTFFQLNTQIALASSNLNRTPASEDTNKLCFGEIATLDEAEKALEICDSRSLTANYARVKVLQNQIKDVEKQIAESISNNPNFLEKKIISIDIQALEAVGALLTLGAMGGAAFSLFVNGYLDPAPLTASISNYSSPPSYSSKLKKGLTIATIVTATLALGTIALKFKIEKDLKTIEVNATEVARLQSFLQSTNEELNSRLKTIELIKAQKDIK